MATSNVVSINQGELDSEGRIVTPHQYNDWQLKLDCYIDDDFAVIYHKLGNYALVTSQHGIKEYGDFQRCFDKYTEITEVYLADSLDLWN